MFLYVHKRSSLKQYYVDNDSLSNSFGTKYTIFTTNIE